MAEATEKEARKRALDEFAISRAKAINLIALAHTAGDAEAKEAAI